MVQGYTMFMVPVNMREDIINVINLLYFIDMIKLLKKNPLYKWYNAKRIKLINDRITLRGQYFFEEGEELLKVFATAMNTSGIFFWLEFGSLLGFYREHDFIKHDCDIDFGVFLKDAGRVRAALEGVGFKLIHLYQASDGGMEECYKYKHTSIDVFYFREDRDFLYCNSFMTVSSNYFVDKIIRNKKCFVKRIDIPNQSFTKTQFKGVDVYVPIDCEKHLKMHYGKDFMIPNSNFNYKTDATNITYYDYGECCGRLKVYGSKYD